MVSERDVRYAGLVALLIGPSSAFALLREDSRTATCYTLACGLLLAWCVMFGRVIVEVAVVNRALVARVLVP